MLLIENPTPPYICTDVASEKNCPDSNEDFGTRHAWEGGKKYEQTTKQTNKQTKKQKKQTDKKTNKHTN